MTGVGWNKLERARKAKKWRYIAWHGLMAWNGLKWLESAGNDNDNENDNDNVNKNDNDIGNNDVDDGNQMVWLYDRVETIFLLLLAHIVCVLGGLNIGATIRTPQEV